MTDAMRKNILLRRSGGGTDLSKATLSSGTLTYKTALTEGVWTINSTQQIGIATSTEQGLSPDRFPVRVVIGSPVFSKSGKEAEGSSQTIPEDTVTTAISYWAVVNASFAPLPFERRPIQDTVAIENLYKYVPNFDDLVWEYVRSGGNKGLTVKGAATVDALSDEIYGVLIMANPPAETIRAAIDKIPALITAAKGAKVCPYVRVATEARLVFVPHGGSIQKVDGLDNKTIVVAEYFACIKLNHRRLAERYGEESVPEGTFVTAAFAIAAMFRFGLYEAYEHQEYSTAYATPLPSTEGKFTITHIIGHRNVAPPSDFKVGDVIDIGDMKLDKSMAEIAPMFSVAAGLNHYMFNHTTGGAIATGNMLTTIAMFQLIKSDMERKVSENVTSVFYEALHPVNKRGMANIFFKSSRVTSHGRAASARRYEELKPDDFLKIRLKPQPAGAHKAYVCAAALKRMAASSLTTFLPWSNSINDCIAVCKSILSGGAYSHIGAMYYTGKHGLSQSSALDNYLPEIAAFMQAMAKNDSLTMSPHLSIETAARAHINWSNLMKSLKGEEFTSMDPELVKRYLIASGQAFTNFDITKEEDWGKAGLHAQQILKAVESALE